MMRLTYCAVLILQFYESRVKSESHHFVYVKRMSFVVVGAGVVGLTTALELQKNFPNARVSVIADKFGVNTTSDVAAGIFRPGPSFSGPSDEITRFVDLLSNSEQNSFQSTQISTASLLKKNKFKT